MEGIVDVARHGKVDFSFDIILFQGETAVLFSVPIRRHLIMLFDNSNQVICVLPSDVFDSEIINHEAELDGAPLMRPQTWGKFALEVTLFS